MSVLPIPVLVTKMLNAPTVKVLIAVLVNRDLLVTEQAVKVYESSRKTSVFNSMLSSDMSRLF